MVEVEVTWYCGAVFPPKALGTLLGYIMNSMKYQDILNQNLAAPARKLGCCWIFQQDNDPKQMSKSTQKWLTEHKIKLLPRLSQSPDLNLWAGKTNGLRFLSLYSTTLLDVTGEDSVLFY